MAALLLMSTTVSPRTPMVSRLEVESVCTASLILGADLHRDLNRGKLARGHDFDLGHVADRHPFEVDRSADFEAGGILEIGAEGDFSGKDAARASRHEEDESRQGCQRHDDQNAHLQL